MEKPKPEFGPPANGIIFFFVILSVGTLAMLKPAFDAYYDGMYSGAVSDRLETYRDLSQLEAAQASWDRELGEIDRDIQRFAEARPSTVAPRPAAEMNLDPLIGWNQLPQEVPDTLETSVPEDFDEATDSALDDEGVDVEGADVEGVGTDDDPAGAVLEGAVPGDVEVEAGADEPPPARRAAPRRPDRGGNVVPADVAPPAPPAPEPDPEPEPEGE